MIYTERFLKKLIILSELLKFGAASGSCEHWTATGVLSIKTSCGESQKAARDPEVEFHVVGAEKFMNSNPHDILIRAISLQFKALSTTPSPAPNEI